MKYLFITALAACMSTAAFAQDKKEATVKIVINENGKERIIEKKFSDLDQADAEIKKLSDSLDINISTSGGKKKIVRVDVNKSHSRMSDQPGKIIIENIEGSPEGGPDKRVIIRRGGPGMAPQAPGAPVAPGFHGKESDVFIFRGEGGPEGINKDFDIQLDGPGMRLRKLNRIHKGMLAKDQGSKTIQGLKATPNKPFNGKISVKFNAPEKGNVNISILDVNGKELANEQIKDFQGDYLGQVDIKKAGTGVYFIRVSQGADGAVRRIKVD
jgi:hypothetical protein